MLFTTGGIADRCRCPKHRVEYVIRTRRIEPVQVLGGRHIYDDAAVERVCRALKDVAAFKRRRQFKSLEAAKAAVAGFDVKLASEIDTAQGR